MTVLFGVAVLFDVIALFAMTRLLGMLCLTCSFCSTLPFWESIPGLSTAPTYVHKSTNSAFYSVDFYYSFRAFNPSKIFIQLAFAYTTLALENCARDGARDYSGPLSGEVGPINR